MLFKGTILCGRARGLILDYVVKVLCSYMLQLIFFKLCSTGKHGLFDYRRSYTSSSLAERVVALRPRILPCTYMYFYISKFPTQQPVLFLKNCYWIQYS